MTPFQFAFVMAIVFSAPLAIGLVLQSILIRRQDSRIELLQLALTDVASKACSEDALEDPQFVLIEEAMPGTAHIFARGRDRARRLR